MTTPERISILYVDDEPENLSAFKATYRRTHDITLSHSAKDALEILKEDEPHIILADNRMPEVTGVEFFRQVKTLHPDSVRILITAYTSSEMMIEAINEGHIDKYLVKPWSDDMMNATIQSGFEIYKSRKELKEKNQELALINERLTKTNNELNTFIYSVSHDLRTPLMSILGLLSLMEEEKEPTEQQNYIDLMQSSIHKMDAYIQNTLNYYRNKKSDIEISKINVQEFVEDTLDSMKSFREEVSFKVSINGEPEIYSDEIRLRICLNNLISNAIKYGKKDDEKYLIEVEGVCTPDFLELHVIDHGIGIPEDEMNQIFEMFSKGKQSKSSKSTGLGLYIVKESLQKINGTVDVESEVNEGSRFIIKVPNLNE